MNNSLALSINDAARLVGCGRSRLYLEIAAGRLPVAKLGRRSLIRREDLDAWLASLPNAKPSAQAKSA